MKTVKWLVLITLLGLSTVSLAATAERPMLARVYLQSAHDTDILRQGSYDIVCYAKGAYVDIVADDADFKRLKEAGLNLQIIHDDLVSFYQSRFPVGTTMGGFRTLSEALSYMDTLHNLYPNLTTARDSIGHTYQGRAIWMMKIAQHPNQDEGKPEFFINGTIHAREPMGMECCLRFMNYLLSNYQTDSTVTYLVNNRVFYFVPIINADGYEYNRQTNPSGGGMWRKNRHGDGVDLNRNWGYMWGYDDIGSSPYSGDDTYRGTSAFSEPETQALRQFIDSRHFKVIMNFHSYGPDFLYSWGYYDGYTPDENLFRIIADSATAQNGYVPGTAWEVLYNTNGDCNDWQYGEQVEKPKILGFVMEVGDQNDGFWPSVSRIPVIWNDALPTLLYLSRIADNPFGAEPPMAPVLRPIGDIYGPPFNVHWQNTDTLNPSIMYELKEMTGLQRLTDNFDVNSANWNLGGFYRATARHHSGSYSLFSGSNNNYNATATLINPVTVVPNDTLKFWTWYSIEQDYDYAYVQLSTDGGANFINLAGNITTTNNPHGNNLGNGITGSSTNWVQAKFPLAAYVGRSVILALRYRTDGGVYNEGFYVDDFFPVETFSQSNILNSNIADTFYTISGRAEGQYYYQVRGKDAENQWSGFSNRELATVHAEPSADISVSPDSLNHSQQTNQTIVYPNDFIISNIGAGPLNYTASTTLSWVTLGTTSGSIVSGGRDSIDITINASSIPAGIYRDSVTISSNDPDHPVLQRPKIVIDVTNEPVGCIYVVGDVNGSGSLNGLDVTYGVSYFKGGTPPPYSCDCPPHGAFFVAGDVNGSCSFNGLDITYMVSYFKGGSSLEPCPDCQPRR